MWALEKNLNGVFTITDGVVFDIKQVPNKTNYKRKCSYTAKSGKDNYRMGSLWGKTRINKLPKSERIAKECLNNERRSFFELNVVYQCDLEVKKMTKHFIMEQAKII